MAVKRKTLPVPVASSTPVPERFDEPSSSPSSQHFDVWSPENELELLRAMMVHKPAGLARHFQMALVHHKLSMTSGGCSMKTIKTSAIWDHLEDFYDLEMVNEIETPMAGHHLKPGSGTLMSEPSAASGGHESGMTEFALPLRDFYPVLMEMRRTGAITIEDSNVYFGVDKGKLEDMPKTSKAKRPTRSTPVGTASSTLAKRRK